MNPPEQYICLRFLKSRCPDLKNSRTSDNEQYVESVFIVQKTAVELLTFLLSSISPLSLSHFRLIVTPYCCFRAVVYHHNIKEIALRDTTSWSTFIVERYGEQKLVNTV